MENFQILREKARQTIQRADHMLTMTYPLLNEPKILVSVAGSLSNSVEMAMTALLEYERLFKRIPSYSDNFDAKFLIFREKLVPRYGINRDYIKMLLDLKEIIAAHNKSPMEFSRSNKYIICSDTYEIRTLTKDDLKRLITKAKVFIEEMHRLTTQNDGIFK